MKRLGVLLRLTTTSAMGLAIVWTRAPHQCTNWLKGSLLLQALTNVLSAARVLMHAPMMLLSTHRVRLDLQGDVFDLVNLVHPMLF